MIPFSRSLAVKTIKVQRHEKGFRFGSNYSKGKDSGWHHFLLGCYTLLWLGTKGNWTRESTPRLTVIQKVTPHVPRHKRSCYFDLRHREACIGVYTWRKETSHAWIWTGLVLNFGQIETHWLDRWGTFELQPFFLIQLPRDAILNNSNLARPQHCFSSNVIHPSCNITHIQAFKLYSNTTCINMVDITCYLWTNHY